MSELHYPDPYDFIGLTYCGRLDGTRVVVTVPMPRIDLAFWNNVPYQNYHLTTCPECLARGPRFYLTERNGYAVLSDRGFLVYIKSPRTGSGQVGTPVPSDVKTVQIGGPR